MKKGFSLIELLIVIAIIGLILSAIFKTYLTILKKYKQVSKQTEVSLEKIIDLNIIRIDIEHAGFGLAYDINNIPISFDKLNKKLTIRSTFNVTNNNTHGWFIVNCTNGWNFLGGDNFSNNQKIVYLSLVNREFRGNGVFGTCPSNDYLIGVPYYQNNGIPQSGCIIQFCNIITYSLSSSQNIDWCNPNTKNLLRRVGGNAINNTGGSHVIDCVADFIVTFDYDLNENGYIDNSEKNINIPNSDNITEIGKKLKGINLYLLIQDGKFDPDFNFNQNSISINGVTLQLPNNYQHYRWKTIYIKISPKELFQYE